VRSSEAPRKVVRREVGGAYRGPELSGGVEEGLDLGGQRAEARGDAEDDAVRLGQLRGGDHRDLRRPCTTRAAQGR
jgi:hypothetical protein